VQAEIFHTVYDILGEYSPTTSLFPIFWLAGICVLGTVFIARYLRDDFRIRGFREIGTIIILPLFLFIGVLSFVDSFNNQSTCKGWARNREFQIVEGKIENLVNSNKSESFRVSGNDFEYSEYDSSQCGYSQFKGIRLADGMYIRISHHHGSILKMEVLDKSSP
jgi:hypothetical protein